MEPIHTIEYELTSALASEVQRKLLRWELRRGWRRDMPTYVGAFLFTALVIGLGLEGLILPGLGVGLVCLIAFFVLIAIGAPLIAGSHGRRHGALSAACQRPAGTR